MKLGMSEHRGSQMLGQGLGFIFVGKGDSLKSFKQGYDRIGAVLSEYQFSNQESGSDSREMGGGQTSYEAISIIQARVNEGLNQGDSKQNEEEEAERRGVKEIELTGLDS